MAFEKIDKPCLQPLPAKRYVYSDWKETKVASNYHVEYDGYFYSVHYSYANRPCSVRATSKTIEVYVDCERVAAHQRNYNPHERYTTLEEHMPDEHKAVYGWSTERFLLWADNIGLNTENLSKGFLKAANIPSRAIGRVWESCAFVKTTRQKLWKLRAEKLWIRMFAPLSILT